MKKQELTHKISTKDKEGNTLVIEITLDRYFAITCMAYEKGKPLSKLLSDKYFLYGGCSHDEILSARPDLKIFVDLHLADMEGVPMHAAANMRYHQQRRYDYQGSGTLDPLAKFAEDYNITREQAKTLENCLESNDRYTVTMYKLGIYDHWAELARQGKELFTKLSGKPAPEDNPEPNGKKPTPEEIATEEEKEAAGHYTPEAIEERRKAAEKAKYDKEKAKILGRMDEKIEEARRNAKFELIFLDALGDYRDNVIYYNHSNTVAYNWLSYHNTLPEDMIEKLKAAVPKGVKVEQHKER